MTDPLSQVLRSLRLCGGISVSWELHAPWGISLQDAPHAPFHFLQSGSCVLRTKDGRFIDLGPGDMVVLFDGAGHCLADSPRTGTEPLERVLARTNAGPGPRRYGGFGASCEMTCGKFVVDGNESAPVTLQHLPPLVHVPARCAKPVRTALELLGAETERAESGSERAAALLTELLFIEVVRAALAADPGGAERGWLEGLRDPQIGFALAAIHGEPGQPWSVDSMARKAGLCRSVFAQRFTARLGSTPMSYLTRFRLQTATRFLRDTGLTVSEISHRLGFGSPASFDRAFKRAFRSSPSAYRQTLVPVAGLEERRTG